MLISRTREVEMLRSAAARDEAQFIAIYGRRRVGKTFLVQETFDNKFTFRHAGLAGGSKREQISSFCDSLRRYGLSEFETPADWMGAFELLKDLIDSSKDERKVVFIDELSWMDVRQGKLLLALESFWNGWASGRKDLLLIVCASATSWMMDKIIHSKGGLYNRLTGQIHLSPFTLAECEEYLQANGIVMGRREILEGYMILGGVPYYWSYFKKGLSLAQNIDAMFFGRDAPLKDEFDFLYASLFAKPESYITIISALAGKRMGLRRAEIVEATGVDDSGRLTRQLEELESCDFIRRYTCFGKKKKDAVYQLVDGFTVFYYKFLSKHPTDEHYWSNQINTPARNAWCGLAFESVCLNHVAQIKSKLGISGVLTETHSWYCKDDPDRGLIGSQTDLLIVRRDRVINVCEMKFSASEYALTKKDDEAMRNRINDIQLSTHTSFALHPTLVTTYGLRTNKYSGSIQSVITADDLFRQID